MNQKVVSLKQDFVHLVDSHTEAWHRIGDDKVLILRQLPIWI